MPSYTVNQLESILGSSENNGEYRYVAPNGSFKAALKQVLPRLYQMGTWRDMTYEMSVSTADTGGYISLPEDTDSLLGVTLNNFPAPVRSMWHDYRISGRSTTLSGNYGIVDAGYHPVLLDMEQVQASDEPVDSTELLAYAAGSPTPVTVADFEGVVKITVQTASGKKVLTQSSTGDLTFDGQTFSSIVSISYSEVLVPFDLVHPDFDDKVIATVPTGSGVLRFRRFRVSRVSDDSFAHLLLKRAVPSDLQDDTVIHLGNIGALKMALLGLVAEDNGDFERSEYCWGKAKQELDRELQSDMGAAKPMLRFDLSGCGLPGVGNMM